MSLKWGTKREKKKGGAPANKRENDCIIQDDS